MDPPLCGTAAMRQHDGKGRLIIHPQEARSMEKKHRAMYYTLERGNTARGTAPTVLNLELNWYRV